MLAFGLLVASLTPGCTGGEEVQRAREAADAYTTAPNVILVSIDTLRADRLSLYGHSRPTSPELEGLARDAVVFERFYQNGGGTLPSHMTMMTSLRPTVHRLSPQAPGRLPDARVTLAEQLRAEGYTTAAWVDGGWVRGQFGFDQGFDSFDEEAGGFRHILPKAKRWIWKHRDEPFFVFLHTYDVHSQTGQLPYSCPGDFPASFTSVGASTFDGCRSGRCATQLLTWLNEEIQAGSADPGEYFSSSELEFIRALYDGCIRYADHELGRLVSFLRDLEIYDRTLIVVTSDHGEELLDHGLFLHTQGGYEELARVPLIMKFPQSAHGGKRVGHLAAMVDLMPTVLEIAGVAVNPEAQGLSLLPAVVEDTSVRSLVTIYSTVRTLRWKLFGAPDRLFDLTNDPAETINRIADHPTTAARLRAAYGRLRALDLEHVERLRSTVEEALLTEENLRELRALGYL